MVAQAKVRVSDAGHALLLLEWTVIESNLRVQPEPRIPTLGGEPHTSPARHRPSVLDRLRSATHMPTTIRRRRRRSRRPGSAVKPHRAFDPRQVGGLETTAWVTYYRREWVPFLRSAVALTRHTFGLPWPSTIHGAWLVLRANQLWAPYPDNDPAGARRAMERFYRLVAERHGDTFDPRRASELEVEWWRVHREHQHDGSAGARRGPADRRAVARCTRTCTESPRREVAVAAEQRALAMRHSDQWVREGCDLASPLIEEERAALVRSYAGLLAAVHRV